MLKINLKKFLSLFLVIVLVTAQVFTAFAHEADAKSSEQNVNPQVNEEVINDTQSNEEIFESEEESKELNKEEETEAETEFVGEELDGEVEEETEELEEPENPDDLIEKEEITEETNDETQTVNGETVNTDAEIKAQIENIETEADETEIEIVEEETSEQKETETTEQTEETTEDDEIEVEIVDGEVIEKTEAETTETTEEELETQEEIAETVDAKKAFLAPGITWVGYPDMDPVCAETYIITIDPKGIEIDTLFVDGVSVLPDGYHPDTPFDWTIDTSTDHAIEIIATNVDGEVETATFPQAADHTVVYSNSIPDPKDYGTRTISAECSLCHKDHGHAEFTTTSGISEVWDEAGITPFADPIYDNNWIVDPLVVEYTNNFKAGKADDPVEANRPTCTLTDSTGTETFAIAYFTITKKSGQIDPPTGLVAYETSTRGSKDGKIEGLIPGEMEWSIYENQKYQTATATVLENLEPRVYYIRFKDTDSHSVSKAADIEVPRGTTPDPKPPSPGGGGSGSGGGGGGGGASRGGAMPSFINIIPYAPIGADPAAGKYSLFYDAVVGAYKATPTVNTIARSPEDSAKPLETGAIDTTKESNQAEGFASGWALVQDVAGQSDNWYYFDPATKFMKTGWVQDNGYLYFTHNKDDSLRGRIYSGWHDVDGQVCYFDETNYCLTAVISKVDALTRGIVTVEDSAAAVTLGNLDLKPTVGSQGLATMTFADQTSIRPGEQNANNVPTLLTVTSSTDLAESRKEFLDSLAALGMIQQ